jgi:hypothetical protein
LKIFQYNYPIFKSGLKETELCTFCSETEKWPKWTSFYAFKIHLFCYIYFILINYAHITIQIAKQAWIMSPY